MKSGFTLIEIIIVLVVFAIVATIGSDILFNAYQNYLIAKSSDTVYYKTEYALDTIEARLRDKIRFTCIGRKGTQGSAFDTIKTLRSILPSEDYKVMECVVAVQEARKANAIDVGWSGFIDLDAPETNRTNKTVATPGSKLSLANTTIYALSHGTADLNGSSGNVVLIFPEMVTLSNSPAGEPIGAIGWKIYKNPSAANDLAVYAVKEKNETTLEFTNILPNEIADIYFLAYTAIAFVPEQQPDGTYNLYLYYNYQPWRGETYKNGEKALIIDKIASLKFRQVANNIAMKLCSYTHLGESNVTFCSERSIP